MKRENEEARGAVALAADHAGVALKRRVGDLLGGGERDLIDLGAFDDAPSDYPDFAKKLAGAVLEGRARRGILICGSGVGACVAANKIRGIRAALCHDVHSARQAVEHVDANVLVLGARVVGELTVPRIVNAFLEAEFSNAERHVRRLEKVRAIEAAQNS